MTAFIVESYQGLKPDSGEATVALLIHISEQLAAASNGSSSGSSVLPYTNEVPFVPSGPSVRVNVFWFLSLLFSLSCALMATFIQQWARQYARAVDRRPTPHHRARVRAFLHDGLTIFNMKAVSMSIPTLLHASVFLFFAGLVQFLYPINRTIAYMALGFLVIFTALYAVATILPTVVRNCPYRTPLSGIWWRVMQAMRVLRAYYPDTGTYQVIHGSIVQGRETLALVESSQRRRRDFEALRWTLESLNDNNELEPFVEGIPAFLGDSDSVIQGQISGRSTIAEVSSCPAVLLQLYPSLHDSNALSYASMPSTL